MASTTDHVPNNFRALSKGKEHSASVLLTTVHCAGDRSMVFAPPAMAASPAAVVSAAMARRTSRSVSSAPRMPNSG
jgi:hypothetical protein